MQVPALFLMIGLLVCIAPERAGAQLSACDAWVQSQLQLDISNIPRMAVTNPITLRLSSQLILFERAVSESGTCLSTAKQVAQDLDSWIIRRLSWLIEEPSLGSRRDRLERFFVEWTRLYAIRLTPRLREGLVRRIQPALLRYLESIRAELFAALETSPFQDLMNTSAQFTFWSTDWTRAIGREAPAAVDLINGAVAIGEWELTPRELQFFLFHELAHLHGLKFWRGPRRGREFAFQNEVHAWQQTLLWIDYQPANDPAPQVFLRIRDRIGLLGRGKRGLQRWVEAIEFSRNRGL